MKDGTMLERFKASLAKHDPDCAIRKPPNMRACDCSLRAVKKHVPHDQLTEGLWYLRTDYAPFYTIVSLTRYAIGPETGELGVWMIPGDDLNGVEASASHIN
jgi:hypothetical protein